MIKLSRLLLFCLLLLSTACQSTTPKPVWVEREVPLASQRVLWEVSRLAMEREGFPVLMTGFEARSREAHSGWRIDLHPFKGEGFRERAVIGYDTGPAGKLLIRARVQHEINDNIAKPLDPAHASWKPAADNEGRAKVMLQYVQSMLTSRTHR